MKYAILLAALLISLSLAGCAAQLGGYNFELGQPQPPLSDDSTYDARTMHYDDDLISISFSIARTGYMGVDGMSQYDNYEGIRFILRNKTSYPILIDWNKVSFTDHYGRSGNAVMHQGIKYNECADSKAPTSIQPGGTYNDIIIPCYAVNFVSDALPNMRWQVHLLPNPVKQPDVTFGIFLPLQIGDETKNYIFEFRGEKAK